MAALNNAKHEAVIQHFVADPKRVGAAAYRKVYKGSTQRAAETAWSRMLKRAEFKARLAELTGEIADRVVNAAVMDLQEVLAELSKLGRSSIVNCIIAGDDTGDVVASIRDLPPEHAAAIQELTVDTYMDGAGDDAREVKRVRIKLHNKHAALAELRRHHEPDRHEHTGKDGKPIETKETGEPLTDLEVARRVAFVLELGRRAIAAKAAKPAAKPKKGKAS